MTHDGFASNPDGAEMVELGQALTEYLELIDKAVNTLVPPDELERRLRDLTASPRASAAPRTNGHWNNFTSVDNSHLALEAALYAAATDIEQTLHDIEDRADRALSVKPYIGVHVATQSLTVTVTTADFDRVIELSLPVLRRAAARRIYPLSLIAYALAEREPLGDERLPHPVDADVQSTDQPPKGYGSVVACPGTVTRRLDRNLDAVVDTVVCGNPSSAASDVVAAWARTRTASGEWGLIRIGMNDRSGCAASIYETLLQTTQHDGYLVVVDGVQSNPGAFHGIRACVEELRDAYGLKKLVLVATAWPSLVARLPSPFKGLSKIAADGREFVDLLIGKARLSDDQRAAILGLVGSDVHLAMVALELLAGEGRIPDRERLQAAVTGRAEDDATTAALYWFACLSAFEIDVPTGLAEQRFTRTLIMSLLDRRVLWINDGAYTIGSRTRARLVLERALAHWDAANRWGDPARVVVDYLNSAGEATIVAILERMDLAGLADDPDASEGTRFLAMIWDQRARLARSLAAHYGDGGTWNDCIGAAVFAAQAFAETGDVAAWRAVAEYVRRRFNYGSTDLPLAVDGETTDYADFPAIVDAMSGVDDDVERRLPGWELAHEVDTKRFYLNWVLGLLLDFEGNALDHNPDRIEGLVTIAKAQQDPRGGHFYPMRVPWVTARVVLGLRQAGHTYASSSVVRAACDWLRRPVTQGGPLDHWWRSGTGPWNTDEMTTAICLTALHRAGAPPNAATDTAMAWLLGQRSEWERREIDLALVVEAMLLYRVDRAYLQEGVLALLQWALTVSGGGPPAADSEIPEDRHRMPFVAAQLTVVIWATMMREFSGVVGDKLRPYRPTEARHHSELASKGDLRPDVTVDDMATKT